jgi:hypothetical protein
MRKNAKLNRNALRGLVAALALGGLQVAHAGYAQLQTPAGFGGTSGNWTYAAAANDKVYGKVVHQAGALTANVGGQAVKMGAGYRLAANAPRIAAAVVMQHPAIRLTVGAVGVIAWLSSAKLVYDIATGTWRSSDDPQNVDGYLYGSDQYGWHTTKQAACSAAASFMSGGASQISFSFLSISSEGFCVLRGTYKTNGTDYGKINVGVGRKVNTVTNCPTGWTLTDQGCLSPALTQPEFVDKLANQPMPQTVPLELPNPTPLPVEQPFINPTPGENPQSQPLRVPTGQPVPIPNTDPQQWRQPYVDIVPAPTPDNPWRVDIKPGETTSTDPNPVENPTPDGEDNPTPEEDKSLCEKHPDILACSKPELDVPDGDIPKVTKQITYAEEGGFGGGSCPSNVYASLHGKQTMVYEWSRTCSVVSTYIRPIILLLGAMGALFILIPGRDS